ncbi:MAG: sulfite exporter TauE/SafE family protein, partial [Anaerolineae bacterium]
AAAPRHPAWVAAPIFAAAIYGGYFGAGLSVIILAVLGVTLDDDLTRLNALKQAIAFAVNVAAALFFVFSGRVVWPVALVMAAGAIAGGVIGGRVAGQIAPALLRRLVVTIGLSVGLYYLVV